MRTKAVLSTMTSPTRTLPTKPKQICKYPILLARCLSICVLPAYLPAVAAYICTYRPKSPPRCNHHGISRAARSTIPKKYPQEIGRPYVWIVHVSNRLWKDQTSEHRERSNSDWYLEWTPSQDISHATTPSAGAPSEPGETLHVRRTRVTPRSCQPSSRKESSRHTHWAPNIVFDKQRSAWPAPCYHWFLPQACGGSASVHCNPLNTLELSVFRCPP